MNLFNLFSQFKANPMQMLQQRYNIPAEINQPDQIINHLVSTGQVTKQQLDQVMGMRNMFRK